MGVIMKNKVQYTDGSGEKHDYSTDEQVVGTWIDGSPLYEKTLQFNNQTIAPGSYVNIDISDLGCDTVVSLEVCAKDSQQKITLPYYLYSPEIAQINSVTAQVWNNYIQLARQGDSSITTNFIATLRYTKATS